MTLLVRIKLALGSAFILAALASGYLCSQRLHANAREQWVRACRCDGAPRP